MAPPDEPRVAAADVRRILAGRVWPDNDSGGIEVAVLAARAGVSTRTVYRAMAESKKPCMPLGLADRLLVAAGHHLSEVALIDPKDC